MRCWILHLASWAYIKRAMKAWTHHRREAHASTTGWASSSRAETSWNRFPSKSASFGCKICSTPLENRLWRVPTSSRSSVSSCYAFARRSKHLAHPRPRRSMWGSCWLRGSLTLSMMNRASWWRTYSRYCHWLCWPNLTSLRTLSTCSLTRCQICLLPARYSL